MHNVISPTSPAPAANANSLLLEAIALRKYVLATYNRMQVKLAPHILFTRHDDVFVDAVTVVRDGQPPKEIKLGTFKLAGLKDLSLSDGPFRTFKDFNPKDIKYEGVTLFVVDPA